MAFEALGELNGKFTKANQPLVAAALYLTKNNSATGTLTPVLEVVIRKDVLERLGWSETTRIAVYEGTGHDRNLLQLRPAKVGFTVTHRPTASVMRVSGPRLRHHQVKHERHSLREIAHQAFGEALTIEITDFVIETNSNPNPNPEVSRPALKPAMIANGLLS